MNPQTAVILSLQTGIHYIIMSKTSTDGLLKLQDASIILHIQEKIQISFIVTFPV